MVQVLGYALGVVRVWVLRDVNSVQIVPAHQASHSWNLSLP